MTAARSDGAAEQCLRPIRIGISACLLGEPVRFDGGHKRDTFLTETFGRFVDALPLVSAGNMTGFNVRLPSRSGHRCQSAGAPSHDRSRVLRGDGVTAPHGSPADRRRHAVFPASARRQQVIR
jgi:hypothetical protein